MASNKDAALFIRTRKRQKVVWKLRAEAEDLTLSEWVRRTLDKAADAPVTKEQASGRADG